MTTQETPDRASIIAFPPLLFGGTLLIGLLLGYFVPAPWLLPRTALTSGLILLLIGVSTLLLAVRGMIQNKTTINPGGATTVIVSDGLYRYTRNPMCLSLTLIYVAVSVVANAWWGLLLLIPLLMVVQKGIVEREEQVPHPQVWRRIWALQSPGAPLAVISLFVQAPTEAADSKRAGQKTR